MIFHVCAGFVMCESPTNQSGLPGRSLQCPLLIGQCFTSVNPLIVLQKLWRLHFLKAGRGSSAAVTLRAKHKGLFELFKDDVANAISLKEIQQKQ